MPRLDRKSNAMRLTKDAVRIAMLSAQGLLSAPTSPVTKADLMAAIHRMGYLQIDTMQAVQRSQYLVLWSRLGDYPPTWLDDLHANRLLFEYFAHALCYIPTEDYPIFRGKMLYDERTGNDWHEWAEANPDVVAHVRTVVKAEGPVSSADFNSRTVSTGWGDTKPEKLALSHLFSSGELMVSHRKKFRRYFNLRERVLPDWEDKDALAVEDGHKKLVLKAVQALGVAREDWVAEYYYLPKTGLSEILNSLADEGRLRRAAVDGWEIPAYLHPARIEEVEGALCGSLVPSHTSLLSPFDPLISDRARALEIFHFDYKLESYTPAKDRRYGYFCLPILHEGQLVGRLDPKVHRQQKRMEIKALHLEPGIALNTGLIEALKTVLVVFSAWHGMETLEITTTDPPRLKGLLR